MTKQSLFAGTALARGFKTSADAERNGVWRLHADSGLWVKIRRGSANEHKRALRKHYKPFSHLTRVDPKDELLVKQKAGAEWLVAEWATALLDKDDQLIDTFDGKEPPRVPLRDANGNEILCTQENVLAAFVEMPDFFSWVSSEADTFENYRVEAVEEAAGNCVPSSAGSASGVDQEQLPSLNDVQPVASAAPSTTVQN